MLIYKMVQISIYRALDTLTDPDCATATCPNHACKQPVRISLFRIMLDGVVEVLELLVANAPQRLDELRQLLTDLVALGFPLRDHFQQRSDLLVVVAANLRLDGLGAGHGRLVAHDGRRPAQAGGEDGPDRVQRRRAHAVLVDQCVEGFKVVGFLVVHVLHQRAELRVLSDEGGCLRRVDEGRGELACLVDSELRGLSS